MSANIESVMWSGEKPWHGLGREVSGLMTAKEAIEAAGLNWRVEMQPMFVEGGLNMDSGAPNMELAEGVQAVVRQTDHKVLGVATERYEPIQNEDQFGFFDAIVQDGRAKYETAGALNGGRRVWMLAKLPDDIMVKASKTLNDKIEKYVFLSSSHDGSGSLRMAMTNQRIVCSNTEKMALRAAGKDGITIRHTKTAKGRMSEAVRAWKVVEEYNKRFEENCNILASTSFSFDQMKELAAEMFPSTGEDVSTRSENNRQTLVQLFDSGKGNHGESAWDAYNSITEYADWHRSTRVTGDSSANEQRFTSTMFGSGALFKDKGFEAIQQLAGLKLAA